MDDHLPEETVSHWYTTARFRSAALWVLVIFVIVEGWYAIFRRDGDFLCHRFVGEAFLTGEPYGHGMVMYPVGRTLMDVVLAIGPMYATRAVTYILALVSVYVCYRTWRRLASASRPAVSAITVAAAAFTAVLMSSYLIRDFDECGLQLFLLFFLSAGLSSLVAGRHAGAGFWLATAVTYKATPIIFLPYLLWKRQWRAAGWMVAFIALWAVAAVPFIGLAKTIQSQQEWLAHSRRVMANRQAYPDQLVEPQRTDNLSLRALLARNLETYPPGHPLFVDHPLFLQPGSLTPEHAYRAVQVCLLAIGVVLAWRFRRRWATVLGSGDLLSEWAAMCLLCAILSPVCWKQHLVVGLPALFLVVRATLARKSVSWWRMAALVGFGVVAIFGRGTWLGRDLSALVHAYKLDTIVILMVLVLVLTLPAAERVAVAAPATTPGTQWKAKAA